ncbi:hypothetical protein ATJ88_2471 [Isoptericola jiangsuensis]|uniref:Uncharacterized protein n=1 Tax=Isoptericola jiangsuensis TaxID=548579 RepID=A0A2A9EXJ3_9MICO|nr:hypothetical protein [Isoptericola jiangsuensis]PFG43764.1 hypothetical protein ATJ88_2471 [Isoptericola jiangsuensis]
MRPVRGASTRQEARGEAYRAARSNLTALQASLPAFSTLSYTEVLLTLEAATDLPIPAAEPVATGDRDRLYVHARSAVERLAEHGDRLGLELVIADLDAVWSDDVRTGGAGDLP